MLGVDKGQNQNAQQAVLDQFRQGSLNVLACTSIGEEGLDIKECNLAIMFDVQKSVKRSIQRTGRTGRHSVGRVVYIVTKNGIDAKNYDKMKAKQQEIKRDLAPNVKYNFCARPTIVC